MFDISLEDSMNIKFLKENVLIENGMMEFEVVSDQESEFFRVKMPAKKLQDIEITDKKSNSSRVYNSNKNNIFFRFCPKTNVFNFKINLNEEFNAEEIEIFPVSKEIYYITKIISEKGRILNLVKSNPHLIKKFFGKVKKDGFKNAILKSKEILNNKPKEIPISVSALNQSKNTKKIMFVAHSANEGGASLLSLNIIKTLKNIYGFDVITILIQGGKLEKELKKYSTVYCLHQNSFSYVDDTKKISKLIEQIRKTGVKKCISNSVTSSIISDILVKNGFEVISLIHELNNSIEVYDYKKAAKNAAKFSKKLIFPNKYVANEFVENYTVENEQILIQPQGIYCKFELDITKEEAKKQICNSLRIPLDSKLIFNCAAYGDIRKGIDVFFEIAKKMVLKDKSIHFIWVGNVDPVYKQWLEYDIKKLDLKNNIHFLGYIEKPEIYFRGTDVYILTSREDPFPSVVLEAMELGTPALAFENTGGIPELNDNIGGLNIKYLDVDGAIEKIELLLENKELYNKIATKGSEYVKVNHNHEKYVGKLLEALDIRSNLKVSVIIPNYNYENYLGERIYSICNQTHKPCEIIFLDDNSSDKSLEKAETILKQYDIPYRIIPNEKNNGCFKQWGKGIRLAEGDIVWIAEADDLCELNFIETLISSFEDQEVNLAYTQSKIINEKSEILMGNYLDYTNDLSTTKWLRDYKAYGQEEIVDSLGIKNTIPNASGVLMRKSALLEHVEELEKYVICGDWFTYVALLKNGKLFFSSKALNMHRRHSQSIVSKSEKKVLFYKELLDIKIYIIENFKMPMALKERFINIVIDEYKRLGCENTNSKNIYDNQELEHELKKLNSIYDNQLKRYSFLSEKKNILLVAPDFEVGGGQMLVIRLANYLAPFHDVYVYSARPWLSDKNVVNMFSSKVKILDSKGDPKELEQIIKKEKIEVINSHIWWSDKLVYKAIKNLPNIKWIISMHGCYDALVENEDWDKEFKLLVREILDKSNNIIYATEKNKKIFNHLNYENMEKTHKIYYGYELQNLETIDKKILSIPEDAIVFGMVARGIKEKGWREAVKATILLNKELKQNVHLVLIGEGEIIEQLKKETFDIEFIHFVNANTKPFEWIQWIKMFDVCLLPTYFVSESLPNSVIEYLAYNKPIISTNIGDIKYMLYDYETEKKAGILLELKDNKVDFVELKNAMQEMLDKDKYDLYKKNSKYLFDKKFKMERFVSDYFELF